MPRNIFIIGAQCAGKTTLVEALAESKPLSKSAGGPPTVISEVVRGVMSTHNFSSNDFQTPKWLELQEMTLEAQTRAEEDASGPWFISDRSALDPIIYARLGGSSPLPLLQSQTWLDCRERMRNALVILCEAGNEAWLSADAQRLRHASFDQWRELNDHFAEFLAKERIVYHCLPKDLTDINKRVEFVVDRYTS